MTNSQDGQARRYKAHYHAQGRNKTNGNDLKNFENDSAKRGITHAKTSANVFGEKLYSAAVGDRVGFRQIFQRLHQHLLAIHVTRVGCTLTLFAR
jgi:hypothetical protein